MLVGRRAQLGTLLPGEGGEEGGVEVDRVQRSCGIDDEVLGFQVAVGRPVGDHRGGQRVECRGEPGQAHPVAGSGGPADRFAERLALDPFVQHDIDPFARSRRADRVVEEELPFEQPFAVDLPQVAHRAQEAPQRPDAAGVADAEDGGGVPDRVFGASRSVAAHLRLAQRAGQPAQVGEGEKILSQRVHGAASDADAGPSGKERPRACLFRTRRSGLRSVRISGSRSGCGRGLRSIRRRIRRRRTNRTSSGPAGLRA